MLKLVLRICLKMKINQFTTEEEIHPNQAQKHQNPGGKDEKASRRQ